MTIFQWIALREKIQEPPKKHGKSPWFPVKIFPTNQSNDKLVGWVTHLENLWKPMIMNPDGEFDIEKNNLQTALETKQQAA